MSMSGGIMSNLALDAALDELGMLSTSTKDRHEYSFKDICRQRSVDSVNDSVRRRIYRRSRPYQSLLDFKVKYIRPRTRSENESDLLENMPHGSSNQLSNMSPVPFIPLLPVDSMIPSNLFKSRSMESIDARISDESVSLPELTDTTASVEEVDSVSSGLHRLNVSE